MIYRQDKSNTENEAVNDEEAMEDETEEENDKDKSYESNFVFHIEDISYEENEEGYPSKIESIKFLMYNRWKSFRPKVVVCWYDTDSEEVIKEKEKSYWKKIK